ncbi:hypothetical protein QJS04_geneDACA007686 [Acorus gramineus]|uniref:Bulb-type lectin domain-containing protein n=1 Tax=Acorus gramineus TaxID=55184 RepID=A0AAV9B648_ACOGR|nr:hypothetical protein QJS04_geneDACA007686 [Acorus gramineus]
MLAMQVDCNLVVYDKGRAVWHTNTAGKGYRDCYLKMQSDGDLVVYSKDGKHRLWSSGTSVGGHKYYNLVLQPNRNVVIYGPAIFHTNTAAVSSAIKGIAMAKWATNTESTPISDENPKNILGTDEILYAESSLTYGDYMLAMQVDCNLVVYDKGRAVWHTNTAGKGYRDCYLKMQSDGDLVVYSKDGKHRLWSSGTSVGGHKYYNLVLQPNRNVVIYGPAIFHTNTAAVSSAIKGIAMVTEV